MGTSARRRLLGTVVAAAALLHGGAAAHAAQAPAGFRPFAPDSVFNQALRDDAPIAARSPAWVAGLQRSVATNGSWINSSTCAMPSYWADADTPRVQVTLDSAWWNDPALQRAWSSVPMPAEAAAARCTDANFAVLQRQPDGSVTQWELWDAKQVDGRWTASWGGVTEDVRADRGVASAEQWSDPTAADPLARRSTWAWNVTASGMSMTAGVITREDLERGSIDHAVALAVNDAASGTRLWPAQRSDGTSADPDALPEGAHLRLDPSLDLSRVAMTPMVRMIAEAAQRYGIVVRDKTYSVNAFMTEQMPEGDDPVPALLDGQYPWTALQAFPWSDLEVLDAPLCTNWGPCENTDETRIAVDGAAQVGRPLELDTRNSAFSFPRTHVSWDLDGDGVPETDGGRDAILRWTPTHAGHQTVAVTTRLQDETTSRGSVAIDVAPADAPEVAVPVAESEPAPTPAPTPAPAQEPAPAAATTQAPATVPTAAPVAQPAPTTTPSTPAVPAPTTTSVETRAQPEATVSVPQPEAPVTSAAPLAPAVVAAVAAAAPATPAAPTASAPSTAKKAAATAAARKRAVAARKKRLLAQRRAQARRQAAALRRARARAAQGR